MGSTLLINGQPLQVGQTGTIVFTTTLTCCGCRNKTPLFSPLFYFSSSIENLMPFLLVKATGTINVYVYNNSGGYDNIGITTYLYYFYITPSTIYNVSNYNNYITLVTISLGSPIVGLNRGVTLTTTISVSNLAGIYAEDYSAYCPSPFSCFYYNVCASLSGTILFTIIGSL
jgi:hypothetical protein